MAGPQSRQGGHAPGPAPPLSEPGLTRGGTAGALPPPPASVLRPAASPRRSVHSASFAFPIQRTETITDDNFGPVCVDDRTESSRGSDTVRPARMTRRVSTSHVGEDLGFEFMCVTTPGEGSVLHITRVSPGAPCARAGVLPGTLLKLNGQPVSTVQSLRGIIARARQAQQLHFDLEFNPAINPLPPDVTSTMSSGISVTRGRSAQLMRSPAPPEGLQPSTPADRMATARSGGDETSTNPELEAVCWLAGVPSPGRSSSRPEPVLVVSSEERPQVSGQYALVPEPFNDRCQWHAPGGKRLYAGMYGGWLIGDKEGCPEQNIGWIKTTEECMPQSVRVWELHNGADWVRATGTTVRPPPKQSPPRSPLQQSRHSTRGWGHSQASLQEAGCRVSFRDPASASRHSLPDPAKRAPTGLDALTSQGSRVSVRRSLKNPISPLSDSTWGFPAASEAYAPWVTGETGADEDDRAARFQVSRRLQWCLRDGDADGVAAAVAELDQMGAATMITDVLSTAFPDTPREVLAGRLGDFLQAILDASGRRGRGWQLRPGVPVTALR
eukprot:TRINITY_DN51595_c0_g1_i1.p1 TRINITY_DN51595_c0_g1~~TRINITY_DN51595_c0_g1_i1.p1  ORF type:complete len:555 (+),score=95.03 TRINITY_DN51595_c0_g1_i1:67-1731(+)